MTGLDDGLIRGLSIGCALVVLAFFLWGLGDVLNPFLLYAALVGVLLPFRGTAVFRPVVATAGALTGIWLLKELGFLLAPFVLAVVGAYVLNPVVRALAARRPLRRLGGTDGSGRGARTAAVAVIAVPIAGAVTALVLWGVPWILQEANALARRAPEALAWIADRLSRLEARLERMRFVGFDGSEWAERIADVDVVGFVQERSAALAEAAWTGVLGLGRGIWSVLTILGYLVLTPVVGFYLLRDWDRFVAGARDLVPPARSEWIGFAEEYDRLLAAYLRGQVTVSLIVGSLTAAGLLLVQFPFAIFLGVIVAVFNIVPYLGLVLSLIPAVGIALASGTVGASLLKVAIVYTIAQSLESAVISPRIVGESTGLHPVWILFAIALGGFFFGFVGLLIAVPVAVGVKLTVVRAVARFRAAHHSGAQEGET